MYQPNQEALLVSWNEEEDQSFQSELPAVYLLFLPLIAVLRENCITLRRNLFQKEVYLGGV